MQPKRGRQHAAEARPFQLFRTAKSPSRLAAAVFLLKVLYIPIESLDES